MIKYILALLVVMFFSIDAFAKVPIYYSRTTEDAYYDADKRIIVLNPDFLARYSPSTRRFILQHEIAHSKGIYNEQAADRYAYSVGRKNGWFNPTTLSEVCESFSGGYNQYRCDALRKRYK
jgi:hypothetical protein